MPPRVKAVGARKHRIIADGNNERQTILTLSGDGRTLTTVWTGSSKVQYTKAG